MWFIIEQSTAAILELVQGGVGVFNIVWGTLTD